MQFLAAALGRLILLVAGDLLVRGAVNMSLRLGVPALIVSLTVVAVGTSLPELATTVMAAFRRQADIAMGNVIGSNIFNLLAIIGITGLVAPVPIDSALLQFDLWVMLTVALILAPFVVLGWTMTRAWGCAFVALYAGYLWMVVT